jgi:hypothetical protein
MPARAVLPTKLAAAEKHIPYFLRRENCIERQEMQKVFCDGVNEVICSFASVAMFSMWYRRATCGR